MRAGERYDLVDSYFRDDRHVRCRTGFVGAGDVGGGLHQPA
jgi:hypothetical protein